MKVRNATIVLACLWGVSGCDVSGERGSASTGATTQTVSSSNRISLNRISLNSLGGAVLASNPVSGGVLGDGSLTFNAVSGLESTPEGRDLLEYAVRCALAPEDVLIAVHDGLTYEYQGLLNLAPEWRDRQLSAEEKNYISACLIAHVNAYGVSVSISARSHGILLADMDEMAAYPVYEGTFFGKVFGEEVKTYACIGDVPDVALAYSSSRGLRTCTDPTDDCGVDSVGRCQDVCESYHPRYGWTGCWAQGDFYAETISTFLQVVGSEALNEICGPEQNCTFECNNGNTAIIDCSSANSCSAACADGSTCKLDGALASSFTAMVSQGSLADVICHEAMSSDVTCTGSQCDIGCTGASSVRVVANGAATADVSCRAASLCQVACAEGSSCEIDCTNANECHRQVTCTSGSECMLQCNGAADCGFDICEGTLQVCAGGEVVCNRECPAA
jgi:hypothetical protein